MRTHDPEPGMLLRRFSIDVQLWYQRRQRFVHRGLKLPNALDETLPQHMHDGDFRNMDLHLVMLMKGVGHVVTHSTELTDSVG